MPTQDHGQEACAYVKHNDGPLLPFYPGLEVSTKGNMVVQELEQCVRSLLLFYPTMCLVSVNR